MVICACFPFKSQRKCYLFILLSNESAANVLFFSNHAGIFESNFRECSPGKTQMCSALLHPFPGMAWAGGARTPFPLHHGASTWRVDPAVMLESFVDVDSFVMMLRVSDDNPWLNRTPLVGLACSLTPGRDPSTMKGKLQLTNYPCHMYTEQVC